MRFVAPVFVVIVQKKNSTMQPPPMATNFMALVIGYFRCKDLPSGQQNSMQINYMLICNMARSWWPIITLRIIWGEEADGETYPIIMCLLGL